MASWLASHPHKNRFGVFYFRQTVPADLRRFFNVVEIYISLRIGNRNGVARLAMSQFCNFALVETLDGLDRA